jgi:RNA polymerase primary sigma factor
MVYSHSTQSTLAAYLEQIGQHRLLTKAEEHELGTRIQAGLRAEAALAELGPDDEQAARLRLTIEEGHAAQHELVENNLKLVVNIAKKYMYRDELLDLVQEGTLGLMRAAQKFDHTKGFRFSTYATWWVRQAVTRYLHDCGRTIRLPVHVGESYFQLRRAQEKLDRESAYDRPVSDEDLAAHLKWSVKKVRAIKQAAKTTASLDIPIGEGGKVHDQGTPLGALLPSGDAPVDETVSHSDRGHIIGEALKTLTEREKRILFLRYGLDGMGRNRTLEEVGALFGLTRERTRQIEEDAKAKLRAVPQLEGLLSGISGSG